MNNRKHWNNPSSPAEEGLQKSVSRKKTSNLSYRSSQSTDRKQRKRRREDAVNADYRQVQKPKSSRRRNTANSVHPRTGNSYEGYGIPNQYDTNQFQRRKSKKKKRGFGCFVPVFFLILLVVGIFLGVRIVMGSAFDKIAKHEMDYDQVSINDGDRNIDDYMNIALFGVDNQDNEIHEKGSRTDCIMVASINKRTKDVKLMSIYRDTYVSINGEYDKINAAYAYGGPELAISTINRNLDLNIQDFATVNFKALADTVDELGGITLTVKSEKELENLNDYIHNMNHINGGDSPKFDDPGDYPFTANFDGNQAVAYSRIRYMAGGDHERANHQRLVVEGIIKKVKKQPWKLINIVNTVLPQCKTSLSTKTMLSLSKDIARYNLVDSQAYPFHSEDVKYNGIYYGFPLTVYSNTIQAHEYLFGTKDYEPTEELGKISHKVENVTDDLGLE